MSDIFTPTGKIAGVYLHLDRKRFEEGYRISKAVNPGVRMEEVIINIDGDMFETTFDALYNAMRSIKKTKAVE